MMSDISSCQLISCREVISDSEKPLNLSKKISNNIDGVCNESGDNIRLSSDLKQKPIFNIDDYSYFQLIAMKTSGTLFPLEIACRSVKGCSEIREKNITYKNHLKYKEAINEWFLNEKRDDVIHSLQYLFINKKLHFDDVITISTRYYPDKPMTDLKWSGNVLEYWCEELINLYGNCLISKGTSVGSIHYSQPNGYYQISLDIESNKINKHTLELIFSSLYKIFSENNTSERFLAATCASSLRNYLCHNPPNGIIINDIIEKELQHSSFFELGDIIIEILREDKLKLLKHANFMHFHMNGGINSSRLSDKNCYI